VIAIKTIAAPLKRDRPPRLGGRRRPKRVDSGDEVEPVAITRVTVIRGQAFEDQAAARRWLDECSDADTAAHEVADALRLLNHAIHAHRVSAADPYAADLGLARARRIRLGYGSGDELVEGRWRAGYDVPARVARGRRRRMLSPEEQFAGILGGRRPAFPSEDLLLRARADLDQGRTRAAALQAGIAYSALESELRAADGGHEARAALREHGDVVRNVASAARERELDEGEVAGLGEALVHLERFVRRRRHAGGDRKD
jgi:hypothetical protein